MSSIGRSPFPSRNRRRLELNEDSFASPSFAMLGSASFARSPSYISPRNNANNKSTQRRSAGASFFDRSPPQSAASASPSNNNNESNNNNYHDHDDNSSSTMNLSQIRALTLHFLGTGTNGSSTAGSPDMAVFYASILYSKTQTSRDAFLYAQSLVANHEYRRAVRVLEEEPDVGIEGVLLTAHAFAQLGEWQEATLVLEDASRVTNLLLMDDDQDGWQSLIQMYTHSTTTPTASTTTEGDEGWTTTIHPISRLCLWRAKCYDATSHPPRAKLFWKRALMIDAKCVAALDHLLDRNLLEPHESLQLVESLDIEPTMDWLRQLYLARLPIITATATNEIAMEHNHENQPPPSFFNDASTIQLDPDESRVPVANNDTRKMPSAVNNAMLQLTHVYQLDQSPEVLTLAAIRAYRRYDLQASFHFCQELMRVDPLHSKAAFCHAATLLALDNKRLLFQLAHAWVAATPQDAKSWFAVGCYYYACRRYHVAQQHFLRATRLDPLCTFAWIAFGCAFAACDESDQALASFRAAQRLAPAETASLLYMGMEYIRTNHLVLAQHSLLAATPGGDPLVWNELGVVHFMKKDYDTAIVVLTKCVYGILELEDLSSSAAKTGHKQCDDIETAVALITNDYWEPTLFNLGHAYRKTHQFELANACFRQCLALQQNAPAYTALGFSLHLSGKYEEAIDMYHAALSMASDDAVCAELLNRALEEALTTKLKVSSAQATSSFRLKRSAFTLSHEEDDDTDVDMSMG